MASPALSFTCKKCGASTAADKIRTGQCRNCQKDIPLWELKKLGVTNLSPNVRAISTAPAPPSSKGLDTPFLPDDSEVPAAGGAAYQALTSKLSEKEAYLKTRTAGGAEGHPGWMLQEVVDLKTRIRMADTCMPVRAVAASRAAAGEAYRLGLLADSLINDIKEQLQGHREKTKISFLEVFELKHELAQSHPKRKLARIEAEEKESEAKGRREAMEQANRSKDEQIRTEGKRLLALESWSDSNGAALKLFLETVVGTSRDFNFSSEGEAGAGRSCLKRKVSIPTLPIAQEHNPFEDEPGFHDEDSHLYGEEFAGNRHLIEVEAANCGMVEAQKDFYEINEHAYRYASTPPNNLDVEMDEDAEEDEFEDDEDDDLNPADEAGTGMDGDAGATAEAAAAAAAWYEETAKGLSGLHTMAVIVNSLRAELLGITHMQDQNGVTPLYRKFWQQQREAKAAELSSSEEKLGVLQAKADQAQRANDNFERAKADTQAKLQALEEAERVAGMAKQIQEESAKIAKGFIS